MKNFILGIIVTLIIGAWITLAVVGVIPVKTAILIPVGIVIGFLITIWIFGLWWNSQEIKENDTIIQEKRSGFYSCWDNF